MLTLLSLYSIPGVLFRLTIGKVADSNQLISTLHALPTIIASSNSSKNISLVVLDSISAQHYADNSKAGDSKLSNSHRKFFLRGWEIWIEADVVRVGLQLFWAKWASLVERERCSLSASLPLCHSACLPLSHTCTHTHSLVRAHTFDYTIVSLQNKYCNIVWVCARFDANLTS